MAKRAANFPTRAWDGTTQSRKDSSHTERPPDQEDWDQMVAELNAVHQEVIGQPWTNLTLQNSWTNKTGLATAGYRTVANKVFLKGVIVPGTLTDGTIIFQLPAGKRPSQTHTFPVCPSGSDTGAANMRVQVGSDGNAKVYGMGSSTSVDLSNIHFFTDQ